MANILVHVVFIILVYIAFGLVALHVLTNPVTQDTLIDVCMNIGMFVGGSTCWIRLFLNWRNRAKITNVVATINDKVRAVKWECSASLMDDWRFNYLMLFKVAATAYAMGFTLSMLVFAYPIFSGNHFLVMWNTDHHSWGWWIHVVLAGTVILYCATYYTLSDVQVLDCILQLTFLYSAHYEKIPGISMGEETARLQIIRVYREMLALKELTVEYLEVIRIYKMYLWTIGYIALAVSSVALIGATDDGLLSIGRLVLYPMYVLGVLAVWGFAGTHFEETVRIRVIGTVKDTLHCHGASLTSRPVS